MPLIFAMFIGLVFLGCGPGQIDEISQKSISQSSKTELQPVVQSVKEIKSEPITTTVQSDTIEVIGGDIEGNYSLKEGRYLYSDNSPINKNITSADLVIEKLDSDDYGFYLTMKIDELKSPIWESGIFHKKGDKFFKRIIYSTNVTEESNITIDSTNVSDDKHLKTEITDEVKITQNLDGIQIVMKFKDGKVNMIWTRDLDGSQKPMTPELKNARHDYILTYRDRFNRLFKGD